MKLRTNKKSRTQRLFFAFFTCGYLLMLFNYSNADYQAYNVMYNDCMLHQYWVEWGYWGVERFFHTLGLNFFAFKNIYLTVAYFLVAKSIYDYSETPYQAMALYLLFPFLLDVVQMRNFMAGAIVIFALRFLRKKTLKNTVLYFLCIFLAFSQHTVAIIYILLYVVTLFSIAEVKKISLWVTIGVFSFFIFCFIFLPNVLLMITENHAQDIPAAVIWTGAGLLITMYIMRFVAVDGKNDSTMLKIAMFSCVFLPLMLLRFDMYRIYRNLIVINYIILCEKASNLKIYKKTMIGVAYAIVLFIVQLSSRNAWNFETVTYSMFHFNYLFQFLGID